MKKHFFRRKKIYVALCTLSLSLSFCVPSYAVTPKSCGKVESAQNGNPFPVLCSDGSPNSEATVILKRDAPKIMGLLSTSINQDIKYAICSEIKHSTVPIEISAYSYVYSLYNWKGGARTPPDELQAELSSNDFCPSAPYVSPSPTPIKNKKSNLIRYIKPLSEFKTLNDINDYEFGFKEGLSSQYEYLSGVPFDTKGLNELSIKFCNRNIFFNISWNYVSKLFWSEAKKAGFYDGCTSSLR
jgi:hypothetical protein